MRRPAHTLAVEPDQFVRHEKIGLTTLTVAEAAHCLEVSARLVETRLRTGQLAGRKVSRQWRVLAVVIAELARRGRRRERPRRPDPRYRG